MPPLSPSFNGYNLVTAVKSVFRKYARFSGRAVLSEFWYWMLFCFLLGSILGWKPSFIFGGNSGGVLGILLFIPTLAVIFRRLHDTGKSGWYSCLLLLPGIGNGIILAVTSLKFLRIGCVLRTVKRVRTSMVPRKNIPTIHSPVLEKLFPKNKTS